MVLDGTLHENIIESSLVTSFTKPKKKLFNKKSTNFRKNRHTYWGTPDVEIVMNCYKRFQITHYAPGSNAPQN